MERRNSCAVRVRVETRVAKSTGLEDMLTAVGTFKIEDHGGLYRYLVQQDDHLLGRRRRP